MKFASSELNVSHIEEVLRKDILIGSANACDGKNKRFLFNPWSNEYRVTHDDIQVDSGQAIEELLDVYNSL